MLAPVLKQFAYIDLLSAADWLKMDSSLVNASGATAASLVLQDLTFTSVLLLGAEGNSLKIAYTTGGTAGAEEVSFSGGIISVKIESGVSTADQIKAAIEANLVIGRYVSIAVSGTGSNPQIAASAASFTSGANSSKYDARLYRVLVSIINGACDWMENTIDGPVLTRQFTGEYDGSNSNVVVPHKWPVRSVISVKIDYNRQFADDSALNAQQFFVRGSEDVYQVKGQVSLEIVGSDIVLRDDNETFIVGRIFSGSVLGSIQLVYTAGWGATVDDLPSDLVHATMQLLEYWYFQRENRDVSVSSKGVRGESYTKVRDDIPEEIRNVAQAYTDISFGSYPVGQRNYFKP